MARDYGSLSPRRNQNAGWQWFTFGAITGMIFAGCVVATLLVTIAFGVLSIPGVSIGPTEPAAVQIITTTPEPATATLPPSVTPTPAPTEAEAVQPTEAEQASAAGGIEIPTSTPSGLSIDAPPLGQDDTADIVPATAESAAAPVSSPSVPNAVVVQPTSTAQQQTGVTINPDLVAGSGGGSTAPAAEGEAVAAQAAAPQEEIPAILDLLQSDLVEVPGGTFQMGTTLQEAAQAVRECVDVFGGACEPAMAEDSFPPRQVTLSDFQIETTEVTYEQYIAFMNLLGPRSHLNGCAGDNPCLQTRNESETSNVSFDGQTYDVPDVINNLPVVNVTWYGAQSYCEALNRRLPTEAEWEYAARGPNGNIYPWGSGLFDTTRAKTSRPVPENPLDVGAVPVATYPTGISEFTGALDMAGNAAEWVQDWYSPDYYSQSPNATDPQGPVGGTERVVRGGSWDAVPFFARSVHRQSLTSNDAQPWLGFRCAADAADAVTGAGNQPLIPANPLEEDAALGLGGDTAPSNTVPTLPPAGGAAGAANTAEEEPLATVAP